MQEEARLGKGKEHLPEPLAQAVAAQAVDLLLLVVQQQQIQAQAVVLLVYGHIDQVDLY